MCKVYNTVGCLTTIKTHLNQNKIDSFHSVQELLSFQNNYATARQQIISNQRDLISEERNNLGSGILELEKEIANHKIQIRQKLLSKCEDLTQQFNHLADAEKSFLQEFTYSFKALFIFIQINYIRLFSAVIIMFSVRSEAKVLVQKRKRLHFIDSNFEGAVKESCDLVLHDLDRKKRAIDEINTSIYGAIGEQKVVHELEKLSDEYILINDFSFSFTKPPYYKQDKQFIKSIQIDHLLVSPSGIFLIETKNWSKESLKNLSLRSPVQQIRRTSFALFKILSGSPHFKMDQHHWGERKIPIRNLIVLINHKPTEEFQHAKILTLDELLGYIQYFKSSLSSKETQDISDHLIKVSR